MRVEIYLTWTSSLSRSAKSRQDSREETNVGGRKARSN
jgi:hypothetical protein